MSDPVKFLADKYGLKEEKVAEALEAFRSFRKKGGRVLSVRSSVCLGGNKTTEIRFLDRKGRIQKAPSVAPDEKIAVLDVAVHMNQSW